MIHGIGTDIIEVARMRALVERYGQRALDRLFTDAEQAGAANIALPHEYFAGRFAAKEAILKSLGTGLAHGIRWREIEILPDDDGRPLAHLSGTAAEEMKQRNIAAVHVSISHTAEYATATAVAETASSGEPNHSRRSIRR